MKTKPLIYLVEDSAIVQQLLEFALLNEFDCEISAFGTAETALNNIQNRTPDIVILDYYLNNNTTAEANGFYVMNQIRKSHPKIPIIVFSGQTNKKTAIELLQAGAVDYISKESATFLDDVLMSVRQLVNYSEDRKSLLTEEQNKTKYFLSFVLFSLLSLALCSMAFII